jgi:UDP-N-acetyl-D-glucosamine dehydrogenase
MPYHVVESIASALNRRSQALQGSQILLLGVAYKKDVDDLRESPALTIIELLRKQGAIVKYNDPYVPYIGKGRKYDLNLSSQPLAELDHYDCVVIVTDHSDYDYERIVRESKLVIDTRNATRGIEAANIVQC